ncbi:exopolysaccharide biosynthesis polyprenyl glycosylphosphotransferase [Bacillus sp. F19]|nr:exopolysaccharide biosynthesis polyprenyl glycosylphosphotransferase [Bacillus sp. F19]
MEFKKTKREYYNEHTKSLDLSIINAGKYNITSYLFHKRLIDIFLAVIGLFITFPAILLFAILIKVETRGPSFFFQERVGFKGENFNVIKLRSMRVDAEIKGAQWAVKDDPRVTRVGAFIRKTRIDELPQLVNVLKGEMSIVGPRPERPLFTEKFNNEFPGFSERLNVTPGLTGWAQVNGGYDITPKEKLDLDLYYINNRCITLDIKVIIKTFKVVLTGDGAR